MIYCRTDRADHTNQGPICAERSRSRNADLICPTWGRILPHLAGIGSISSPFWKQLITASLYLETGDSVVAASRVHQRSTYSMLAVTALCIARQWKDLQSEAGIEKASFIRSKAGVFFVAFSIHSIHHQHNDETGQTLREKPQFNEGPHGT